MARLPLVPSPPPDDVTAEVFGIFAREGRKPIALYRALANNPELLRDYSTLAQALRYRATTPRELRELVILRTAQLTRSEYEWAHHRVMAANAGLAEEKIAALEAWRSTDAFDARERAALRCAEEMHAVTLSDEAFAELRAAFGDPEIVELVLLVAFYQAVARMIQAFGLQIEPEYEPHRPTGW